MLTLQSYSPTMKFREALLSDIPQLMKIRLSVKENILTRPEMVTEKICEEFLTGRGKGWVCEIDEEVVGFSIVDLKDKNVWALFIDFKYEKKGIGKHLLELLLDWYFQQTKDTIWLGTDANTRAENFYRMQGWYEAGLSGTKEIKFEMSYADWVAKKVHH